MSLAPHAPQPVHTFDLTDVKQLVAAGDHVNHVLANYRRGRGLRARFVGKDPFTGWGQDLSGRILAVGTLFTDHDFAVTFLVETPRRFYTVGGHDAVREDVAAHRLEILE